MTRPTEHLFTAAEAAESLGITPRAFRAWDVDPVAEHAGKRYYSAEAIIGNGIEAMQRRRRRPETTAAELKAAVDALETELTRQRTEAQRLRNAEARGELVSVQRLTDALATACTRAAAALEPLPGKIKRACPQVSASELHSVQVTIARRRNGAAGLTLQDLQHWSN